MSTPRTVASSELPAFPFGLRAARGASAVPAVASTGLRLLRAVWTRFERLRVAQTSARRLRVVETVSLGDKRFVSILHVDGTQFLIGGSAADIQLLARLDPQESGLAASVSEEQDPA